jgi:hypothetical protein
VAALNSALEGSADLNTMVVTDLDTTTDGSSYPLVTVSLRQNMNSAINVVDKFLNLTMTPGNGYFFHSRGRFDVVNLSSDRQRMVLQKQHQEMLGKINDKLFGINVTLEMLADVEELRREVNSTLGWLGNQNGWGFKCGMHRNTTIVML